MVNGGLYLVISNIAVVPAFIEALALGQLPEVALLGSSGIISMFYHLCQNGYFCIKGSQSNYSILQNTDQLIDFVLILWFVGYIIRLTEGYGRLQLLMSAVFIGLAIVLVPLYGSASFFVYEIAVLASGAALFVLVSLIFNYLVANTKDPLDPWRIKWDVNPKRKWVAVFDFAITLIFVIVAIILFYLAGNPGDKNYDVYHATWHILIYLSVVFILDIPYGNIICVKNLLWPIYGNKEDIQQQSKEPKNLPKWAWEPWEHNWSALLAEINMPSRRWSNPEQTKQFFDAKSVNRMYRQNSFAYQTRDQPFYGTQDAQYNRIK